MKQNNSESENYLGNIADELGTISGTCTEIKEAQLNSATVEDVERVGNDVKTAMDASIKNLDKTISEPWGILNNLNNIMKGNTETNREVVMDAEERLSEKFDSMESKLTKKLEAFTAKPPVRETIHHIAKETWQWYLTIGCTVASAILFAVLLFWQEGRIEQCRTSDIKYRFIQMYNGVNSEGLDSIESWFQNPEMIEQIENEVREYQNRVEETARALQQKHRLEEKLNELNAEDSK
jgi:hypothetical protein